ncbi:MAG: L-2-amino-thiazoline-4-carboxylic acid hydrolase, partial [Eubacteriales bacterium]
KQVEKVCRRMALLHLSYAKTIIKELGKEKGKKLVLKAIKDYGLRIGSSVKKEVEKRGLTNISENYEEDLPEYGMHEKVEHAQVDDEKGLRSYGCVMGKLWHELGEDEIGRLYCYVDPAKYMAYNPDYALVHTKSIPDGDDYCEFIIRKTTKKEQEDFLDQDKDWSYIDK